MNARRLRGRTMERGASSVMAMICALIMLISVLVSTHILVSLQRRSVAHAVAVDVATDAARVGGPSEELSTDRIRRLLGPNTRVEWSDLGADLGLRVRSRPRSIIAKGPLERIARIDIRVTVHKEGLVGE